MALSTCIGAALVLRLLDGIEVVAGDALLCCHDDKPPDRIGHVRRLMNGVRSDLLSLAPLLVACVFAIGLIGPWQFEGLGIRLLHGLVAVASVTLAVYAASYGC